MTKTTQQEISEITSAYKSIFLKEDATKQSMFGGEIFNKLMALDDLAALKTEAIKIVRETLKLGKIKKDTAGRILLKLQEMEDINEMKRYIKDIMLMNQGLGVIKDTGVTIGEAEDDILSSKADQDVETDVDTMPTPDTEEDVVTTDKIKPQVPTAPTVKENDLIIGETGVLKDWPGIVKRVSGDRLSILVFCFITTAWETRVELDNYPLADVAMLPKEHEHFNYLSMKVSSGRPATKLNFEGQAKKFLKATQK